MHAFAKAPKGGARTFEFSSEVPIDIEHTLDQLLGRFAQVRDGLPELVKNSKDQYLRLGVSDRQDRQIVVLIDTKARTLGVLDFAGASRADFEHWKTWSGKQGARQSLADQIEAGHGNGGKAFMVRGATKTATIESCFGGRYTRMGYQNDDESVRYKPGFGKESGVKLDNIIEGDALGRLNEFLANFGLASSDLPNQVQAAFKRRKSYTGVAVDQVTEWSNARADGMVNRVKRLAELLRDHGQTALTLETCDVWLVVDGECFDDEPLSVSPLEPHAGFEHPIEIPIPDILIDPRDKESVVVSSTGQPAGKLRLETTKANLSLSEDLKARNVVRVWNSRNNVANWPLPALGLNMPSVYFIRGRLDCPALSGEHLSGADRNHLSDTPLVRALQSWTVEQIKELALKIQQAQAAETAPQEQERARKALKAFRDLMRDFLEQKDSPGDEDNSGTGAKKGTRGSGHREERDRDTYGSRIDRIVLEHGKTDLAIAEGTKIPLLVSCQEDQPDGTSKPVRAGHLIPKLDKAEIISATKDSVEGRSAGVSLLWFETEDGRVKSNEILVEVVKVASVDISEPKQPLKQGERVRLEFSFKTPAGSRDDLLVSASVDEPEMGSIGRNGMFTAGGREGNATIRLRYGATVNEQVSIQIAIGPDRVQPRGLGGDSGSDIPEILICGEEAPGMSELPADQRTHHGGPDFPTIIEEPQFPNVVWLNHQSVESKRVRKSMGTPKGLGGIGNKTFAQFMALKCFEVLKRLHVRQQIRGEAVTEAQFLQAAAFAEMDCANFIDAAWEASETIFKKVAVE